MSDETAVQPTEGERGYCENCSEPLQEGEESICNKCQEQAEGQGTAEPLDPTAL